MGGRGVKFVRIRGRIVPLVDNGPGKKPSVGQLSAQGYRKLDEDQAAHAEFEKKQNRSANIGFSAGAAVGTILGTLSRAGVGKSLAAGFIGGLGGALIARNASHDKNRKELSKKRFKIWGKSSV